MRGKWGVREDPENNPWKGRATYQDKEANLGMAKNVVLGRLSFRLLAKVDTLLFKSYIHTSQPFADLLVDEFICKLIK